MEAVKTSASFFSARNRSPLIGEKGVIGCGYIKAFVRFLAAFVAASAYDVDGMEKRCGENFTVRAILSPYVFRIYTFCQW